MSSFSERIWLARRPAGDTGVSLIELLVALILSAVLGGLVLSTLLAGRSSSAATTNQVSLTAGARGALNRITDDLSDAQPVTQINSDGSLTPMSAISAVQNPDGPGYNPSAVTSVTFQADFNGGQCIVGLGFPTEELVPLASPPPSPCPATALNVSAPEVETFCWSPTAAQLYLIPGPVAAGSCTPSTAGIGAQPLLAGKVTGFELFYRSSDYRYQNFSGLDPTAGITTWYDLDAAGPPVGNNNGQLDVELARINLVDISLTMSQAGAAQTFTTSVELRNVYANG